MLKSKEDPKAHHSNDNTPSDKCRDLIHILQQSAHLADFISNSQSPSASQEAVKDYLSLLVSQNDDNDESKSSEELVSVVYYACVRLCRKREQGIMICNLTSFEEQECKIILDLFIKDILPLIKNSHQFTLCHEIQLMKLLNSSVQMSYSYGNNINMIQEVLKCVKRGLELCQQSSKVTKSNKETDLGALETETFLIQSLLTSILKCQQSQQYLDAPHLTQITSLNDDSAISLDLLLFQYLPVLKNNLVSSISSSNSLTLFNSSDSQLLFNKLKDSLFTSNLILLSTLYSYQSSCNPTLQLQTLHEASDFLKYLKLSINQSNRMTCLFRLCNLFLQHSDVVFAAFFAFLVRNSKNVERWIEKEFDSIEFLKRFDEDAVLEVLEGEEGKIIGQAIFEMYNERQQDQMSQKGEYFQPLNEQQSPIMKRIKILISKLHPQSTQNHKDS